MRSSSMTATQVQSADTPVSAAAGDPRFAGASAGPLARFRSRVPHLWSQVEPLCAATEADRDQEMEELRAAIAEGRARRAGASSRHPGDELEALLAGWPHFDSDRRAVLRGAVRYLATDPSSISMARQEQLVGAAVAAVLRRNE